MTVPKVDEIENALKLRPDAAIITSSNEGLRACAEAIEGHLKSTIRPGAVVWQALKQVLPHIRHNDECLQLAITVFAYQLELTCSLPRTDAPVLSRVFRKRDLRKDQITSQLLGNDYRTQAKEALRAWIKVAWVCGRTVVLRDPSTFADHKFHPAIYHDSEDAMEHVFGVFTAKKAASDARPLRDYIKSIRQIPSKTSALPILSVALINLTSCKDADKDLDLLRDFPRQCQCPITIKIMDLSVHKPQSTSPDVLSQHARCFAKTVEMQEAYDQKEASSMCLHSGFSTYMWSSDGQEMEAFQKNLFLVRGAGDPSNIIFANWMLPPRDPNRIAPRAAHLQKDKSFPIDHVVRKFWAKHRVQNDDEYGHQHFQNFFLRPLHLDQALCLHPLEHKVMSVFLYHFFQHGQHTCEANSHYSKGVWSQSSTQNFLTSLECFAESVRFDAHNLVSSQRVEMTNCQYCLLYNAEEYVMRYYNPELKKMEQRQDQRHIPRFLLTRHQDQKGRYSWQLDKLDHTNKLKHGAAHQSFAEVLDHIQRQPKATYFIPLTINAERLNKFDDKNRLSLNSRLGAVLLTVPEKLCYARRKPTKAAVNRPKKSVQEGTKQYQLKKYAEATLGSGSLRQAVVLPEGEDLNEWLAVNTVDFFNQINMLYGTVTEFCTPQECPVMCAGPRYEYHWQDGVNYKKPTKLSAPEYVDALMNWVQGMLDDQDIFPSKIGVPFPRTFHNTVKSIVRRLFRVYAHLYNHHFAQLCALSIEAHINTSYRHFLLFVNEFSLIDKKELAPLADLNDGILADA